MDLTPGAHRPSQSDTPGHDKPADDDMGLPLTTQGPQSSQSPSPVNASTSGQDNQPHSPTVYQIHPHVAKIGRVDAQGPPSPEHPIPLPPDWLTAAIVRLQRHYPLDIFMYIMRYTAVSTVTDLPINVRPEEPIPDNVKFMYYPRIKCRDCPGKLYTPGPDLGVGNFEVHLKNKYHRERVDRRVAESLESR